MHTVTPPRVRSSPNSIHTSTAGPVNIHERVRNAMIVPGENHRDAFFAPFFKDVLEHSKYLFQTKTGTPFIFPGTCPCLAGRRSVARTAVTPLPGAPLPPALLSLLCQAPLRGTR